MAVVPDQRLDHFHLPSHLLPPQSLTLLRLMPFLPSLLTNALTAPSPILFTIGIAGITKAASVPTLSTTTDSDCDDHVPQQPGVALPLGHEVLRHWATLGRHSTVCKRVPGHQINTSLCQLLVEGKESLPLIRTRQTVECRPARHTSIVSHPPTGRLLLQAAAPLSVAAVLVQTGQAATALFSLPEISLLEWLEDITTEAFDNELNEVLSVDKSALEEPHDDDMVGKRHGVVVELERVGVGESDGKHR